MFTCWDAQCLKHTCSSQSLDNSSFSLLSGFAGLQGLAGLQGAYRGLLGMFPLMITVLRRDYNWGGGGGWGWLMVLFSYFFWFFFRIFYGFR